LEGEPLSNYEEFELAHRIEILALRDYHAPNCVDLWEGDLPRVVAFIDRSKEEKCSSCTMGGKMATIPIGDPLLLNPTSLF
jgi:hypothetical protein